MTSTIEEMAITSSYEQRGNDHIPYLHAYFWGKGRNAKIAPNKMMLVSFERKVNPILVPAATNHPLF